MPPRKKLEHPGIEFFQRYHFYQSFIASLEHGWEGRFYSRAASMFLEKILACAKDIKQKNITKDNLAAFMSGAFLEEAYARELLNDPKQYRAFSVEDVKRVHHLIMSAGDSAEFINARDTDDYPTMALAFAIAYEDGKFLNKDSGRCRIYVSPDSSPSYPSRQSHDGPPQSALQGHIYTNAIARNMSFDPDNQRFTFLKPEADHRSDSKTVNEHTVLSCYFLGYRENADSLRRKAAKHGLKNHHLSLVAGVLRILLVRMVDHVSKYIVFPTNEDGENRKLLHELWIHRTLTMLSDNDEAFIMHYSDLAYNASAMGYNFKFNSHEAAILLRVARIRITTILHLIAQTQGATSKSIAAVLWEQDK